MKHVLVIGAGEFGHCLISELRAQGCAVDVLDKNPALENPLARRGCRVIVNNAWNVATIPGLCVADYDCCYLCIGGTPAMLTRAISGLRRQNAKRIVVRARHSGEAALYTDAGADFVICPAQYASRMLVEQLQAADAGKA